MSFSARAQYESLLFTHLKALTQDDDIQMLSTISTEYVVTGLLYLNLVDSRLKGYVEMRKV